MKPAVKFCYIQCVAFHSPQSSWLFQYLQYIPCTDCLNIVALHTNAQPFNTRARHKHKVDRCISDIGCSMSHQLVCPMNVLRLCFNGKLAHWKYTPLLELFCRMNAQLVFRQHSPHCTRLLRPQVFRHVPTLLVEFAQVLFLRLVNDRQNTSNGLPHHPTAEKHDPASAKYNKTTAPHAALDTVGIVLCITQN